MNASQETATLVKRLAGPSTGKAGLQQDQTNINRVIADASKGSKFYDNEKKKDKDLTEKIRRILSQRDEALRGADLASVEKSVDRLLVDLETNRDLSQTIVHADMDAFFANVELLDNPTLKGKPFGVGQLICTASYEARKFGVRSGMPGFIAKKLCPELIIVPLNHSRYSEMSEKIMTILARYDPNFCPAGCDEAYLNITSYIKDNAVSAEDCVQQMRAAVFKETNLTVSAGIAPNKLLAKICSDKNKPNGQFKLSFDSHSIVAFMRDLSIRKVHGIGRVNERLLESIGVKTCGDIYTHRAVISLMDKQFGLMFLLRTHLGIASNVVAPYLREERKSIGVERTFNTMGEEQKMLGKLQEIAEELEKDMTELGFVAKTVTLKYKLDTYQVFTRSKSFNKWVSQKEVLYNTGKDLLMPELPLKIRLIGLRVTKLKDLRAPVLAGGIKQFFAPQKRKLEEINDPRLLLTGEAEDEDVMPGFHDEDVDLINQPEETELESLDVGIQDSGRSSTETSSKPLSKTNTSGKPQPESLIACPICEKKLDVDNQGMNAHIDWCLSRNAIRDVQSEAIVSPKPKPPSKSGGDTWKWKIGQVDVTPPKKKFKKS